MVELSYRGYIITAAAATVTRGGWYLTLSVRSPAGAAVVNGLSLGNELTFATRALAEHAGVQLAKFWVDTRGTD